MAQQPLPVVGGPADGEEWERRDAFVQHRAEDGEWYCYHRVARRWYFMGVRWHRCLGCDAIVGCPRSEDCPLCGATGQA